MAKAKVLIINTNIMCYDGILSTIFNYTENMQGMDIIIDFVAINEVEGSIRKRIHEIGANLYILPFRIKNPFKYIVRLSKILREGKYTLAHIHGSSCIMTVEMIAAKIAGVPACPHSHSTNCQHKRIHKLLKPLFCNLYKNGFACSIEAGNWLYGNRPFEVINNGINVEKFMFNEKTRIEFRDKLGLCENDIGIIHIGHFTEVKNHRFLINVFKKVINETKTKSSIVNNFKLFLLGDGKLRKNIEEMVIEYGLRNDVIFIGVTQEVPKYFFACDLMVLPSLYEGFPFTAIEAQATGIRCLVSDKVTRECCFSEDFKYILLEEKAWVAEILACDSRYDRKKICEKNQKQIINGGYDIKVNANKLKQLYVEYGK